MYNKSAFGAKGPRIESPRRQYIKIMFCLLWNIAPIVAKFKKSVKKLEGLILNNSADPFCYRSDVIVDVSGWFKP